MNVSSSEFEGTYYYVLRTLSVYVLEREPNHIMLNPRGLKDFLINPTHTVTQLH